MAGRPKKHTVDYFPHVCRHGKTMFILEQKYGNDGYAFWFKLLEMLGDTEDHHLDCSNSATWEFLQSKMHLSEDTCLEVLNLLARLDAIDFELWQNRIIWSENFIKGIAEVYRNRRVEIPIKPNNYTQKLSPDGISGLENTQSRVEESKVKKRKEKLARPPQKIPPFFACKFFEIDQDYFNQLEKDYPALAGNGRLLEEIKKAADFVDDNSDRFTLRATGFLKNPKLFLRNWLSKTIVAPQGKRVWTKDDEVEEWKKRTLTS